MRTTDAARDMDLMRQVLGDDKLHYFGISYGTELGGVYAHLFPKNVGRAVFDAVVDPTQNAEQGSLGQAKGFQLALDNFAEDCTSKTRTARSATPRRTSRTASPLLKDLDSKPIPGVFPRGADPDRRDQRHRAGAVLARTSGSTSPRASNRRTTGTAGL